MDRPIAIQSISSGLLLSLVLTVVGLMLARPLLRLANGEGEPEAVAFGIILDAIYMGWRWRGQT